MGACTNPSISDVDRYITYDIRIHPEPQNGHLRLSSNQVFAGTWITIYSNPEPGYRLESIILQNESEKANPSSTAASLPKFSTQINKHTAVTAKFAPVTQITMKSISVDPSISGGLILPDRMVQSAGLPVKIEIIPQPGFDLVPGSLKVVEVNPITGTTGAAIPVSGNMPYIFSMPAENVKIEGRFERLGSGELKNHAWEYLSVGQYDTAAGMYESAYQLNKKDPDLILYSSLALLGKILIDPDVRSLLGSGSLYFSPVPSTIDDWVCDDVYWTGTDPWYREYAATTYTPEDATLPRFYNRFSGYVKPFGDSPIAQQPGRDWLDPSKNTIDTREKFYNYLFWALISSYRSGFNPFLERVNRYVFGEKFNTALARAETLPDDARVELNPRLLGRFGLADVYGSGTVYIGKPEINFIFGNLLAVKAAFEYLSVYDWTIDMRNWLMDYVYWNDGIEEILDQMFSLQENYTPHKNLWTNPATVSKMLPFRNNFLTVRDARSMGRAVTNISKAIEKVNAAMDYWYGGTSGNTAQFIPAGQSSRLWMRQAWAQAKTAMANSNGIFYFPERLPRSVAGSYWPDGSQDDYNGDPASVQYGNKVYGVKLSRFFTPGAFSLTNFFTTEDGGRIPALFKVEWYEDAGNSYAVVFTGNYYPVTEPIIGSGREENVAGTGFTATYGIYSFEINTSNLKALFPKGFGNIGDNNNGRELFYKVFPSIPLWPWGNTWFTGLKKPAKKLYEFYH
jgi:hypothetical protein